MPPSTLIGGNGRSLSRDGLRFFEECERLGPIVRTRVFHKTAYVVTGPELIEQVLVKNAQAFAKPVLLKDLRIIFGDSLLTADGDLWKHRRRMIQPAFQPKRIPAYAKVVEDGIAAMLSTWRSGEARDFHGDIADQCILNLTRTLFGVSDHELTRDVRQLATVCHEFVQSIGDYRWGWLLFASFPKVAARRLTTKARAVEQRIEALAATHADTEGGGSHFLGRIVKGRDADGCPMSGRAIRDESITMLLAGHETAAAAVSWCLFLLATNRDVLGRLQAELDSVCGSRLPTFDDLPRLPWLDKVLLETYRLYPPTHRIGRTVVSPLTIGGVDLEPGVEVLIPQWAVHRSARLYEAPTMFHPGRWTDDFIDQLPKFGFLPFSGGPRVCIGEELVTVEDALLIGSIVKQFDFEHLNAGAMHPIEGLTLLPGGERGTTPLLLRSRHVDQAMAELVDSDPAPLSSARFRAPRDADEGDA